MVETKQGEPTEHTRQLLDRTLLQVNTIAKGIYRSYAALLPSDVTVLDAQAFHAAVQSGQERSLHPEFHRVLNNAAKRAGMELQFTTDAFEMWGSYSQNRLYVNEEYLRKLRTPEDAFKLGNQLAEHAVSLSATSAIYDGPKAKAFIPYVLGNMQNEGGIGSIISDGEKRRLVAVAKAGKAAIMVHGSSMRITVDGKNLGLMFDATPEQVIINYLAQPIKQEFIDQLTAENNVSAEDKQRFERIARKATTIGVHNPEYSEPAILAQLVKIGLIGRVEVYEAYRAGQIPPRMYKFK